jgi:glycosyltransferase involved in cell wall biosynthesis
METEIISPYVDLDVLPPAVPFADRIVDTAVVNAKLYGDELVPALEERLRSRGIPLRLYRPGALPHDEYLALLGRHRFCICLAPLEGFALVPLESLALGTVPLGFHGNGALDYLDDTTGQGLTRYPDLDGVVDRVERFVGDPAGAEVVARAGPGIAAPYRREVFDAHWTERLARFLGESPRPGSASERPE